MNELIHGIVKYIVNSGAAKFETLSNVQVCASGKHLERNCLLGRNAERIDSPVPSHINGQCGLHVGSKAFETGPCHPERHSEDSV